ncbi:MAG: hypothetical protein IKB70_00070 [Bacilli bacterium]|nr:hypothetical protein [Bacilli bacterium]
MRFKKLLFLHKIILKIIYDNFGKHKQNNFIYYGTKVLTCVMNLNNKYLKEYFKQKFLETKIKNEGYDRKRSQRNASSV